MNKEAMRRIKVPRMAVISFYALLAATCYAADVELNGDVQVTGNLAAGSFTGDGSGLTNVSLYESTVIVSPAGTDTESGDDLISALAGITDASVDIPYLLKIEPGIYNIGTASLQMKPYVDIEGSGELVTTILGGPAANGVVNGASNAEIRSLTVRSVATAVTTFCVYNDGSSPRITNVTAMASGAYDYKYCIYNINSSSPIMTNVTVNASGGNYNYGIYNINSSSPTMTNVTVTVKDGIGDIGIYCNSSSPTMTNATVSVSGGNDCRGISNNNNSSSSPTMSNITVTVKAGNGSYGIYNNSSSPAMRNVTAIVSVGTNIYGIYNNSSSPTMTNVRAEGKEYGMYNGGTAKTIYADSSTFKGDTNSIYNASGYTLYLGASKLDGPADGTYGTYNCAHCYDETYSPLGDDCQPPVP